MEVNFSPNLFLSVEELNKLKDSLSDSGWKRFAKNLVSQYGIAMVSGGTNFSPKPASGTAETLSILPGIAFDKDMNAIVLNAEYSLELPASAISGNNKYWVIVRYASNHYEVGKVSVTTDGALNGVGTEFTKVLRGQPDFPTKVHFTPLNPDTVTQNTGDYEVVCVNSDSSAIIAGNFTAESDLLYSVVGTFTPGFIPSDENKQIYTYDSCEIYVYVGEELPADFREGYDFVIATVDYITTSGGVAMNVKDYRNQYTLNEKFDDTLGGKSDLAKNSNVSLVRTDIVSVNNIGIMIDCVLQHGFQVEWFDVHNHGTYYSIAIDGKSNMYHSIENLPNSIFKGWLLLNRQNMQYCTIDDYVNGDLIVTDFNADAIPDSLDFDLVIVPPFSRVEYEVKISDSQSYSSYHIYYGSFSIENINNHIQIPSMFDGFEIKVVSLKYRFIAYDEREKYPFNTMNLASYIDAHGEEKMLGYNGTLNIYPNDWKPDTVRNYS